MAASIATAPRASAPLRRSCAPARPRAAAASSSSTGRRVATAGRPCPTTCSTMKTGGRKKPSASRRIFPICRRSSALCSGASCPRISIRICIAICRPTSRRTRWKNCCWKGANASNWLAFRPLRRSSTRASTACFRRRTASASRENSTATACWRNLPRAAAGFTNSARWWTLKAPSSGSPWASISAPIRRRATSASLPI